MEYNTTRTPLAMLEYGRGIAGMADFLLTIEDPQKCRQQADLVIDAMAALNPSVRAMDDYKQKLWDQLHLMTNLKLECESPYPKPQKPEEMQTPERPSYPQNKMRHRQFGKRFDEILKRALEEKDPQKQQAFTQALGYYMKLAYTTWHKEQMPDEAIRIELERLSDGLLKYEPGGIAVPFVPLSSKGPQSGNRLVAKSGGNMPQNNRGNFKNSGAGSSSNGGNAQRAYGNSRGRKFFKHRSK